MEKTSEPATETRVLRDELLHSAETQYRVKQAAATIALRSTAPESHWRNRALCSVVEDPEVFDNPTRKLDINRAKKLLRSLPGTR